MTPPHHSLRPRPRVCRAVHRTQPVSGQEEQAGGGRSHRATGIPQSTTSQTLPASTLPTRGRTGPSAGHCPEDPRVRTALFPVLQKTGSPCPGSKLCCDWPSRESNMKPEGKNTLPLHLPQPVGQGPLAKRLSGPALWPGLGAHPNGRGFSQQAEVTTAPVSLVSCAADRHGSPACTRHDRNPLGPDEAPQVEGSVPLGEVESRPPHAPDPRAGLILGHQLSSQKLPGSPEKSHRTRRAQSPEVPFNVPICLLGRGYGSFSFLSFFSFLTFAIFLSSVFSCVV